jgi:cytochrome bd ubiquinol oxidase subunit I
MAAETTRYAVEIPKLGSLILTHDWNGRVQGLKNWPREDRPNAAIVFWSFRLMVGLGLLMVLTGLVSLWLRWRARLYASRRFHALCIAVGPAGLMAILAGWVTTEVGRQPWVVYGLMRTAEGTSPVSAGVVGGSLVAFVVVYCTVFGIGIGYMLRLMREGPVAGDETPGGPGRPQQPMRPLSAASERRP